MGDDADARCRVIREERREGGNHNGQSLVVTRGSCGASKGKSNIGEPTSEVRLTQLDATGFPEKPCLIDPFLFTRDSDLYAVLHRLLCADVQYTSMGVWVLGNLALCEPTSEEGRDCVCSCSTEGVLRHLSTFDYAALFIWTNHELHIDIASW